MSAFLIQLKRFKLQVSTFGQERVDRVVWPCTCGLENAPCALGEIPAKVLTERLRLLENAGVVARAINPTIPPEVTYSLTPEGLELVGVFESLDALAKKWAAKATTQDADSAMR